MPAIGITGGIATGKSLLCKVLRELVPEATVFNADQAARDLTDHDAEVKREIAAEFGPAIFSAAGELNRAQLRAIVFASAERRGALEEILHPRIRSRWSAEAQTHRHSPNRYFFADIPLLYETAAEPLCDRVVVVACAPDIQLQRLLQRSMGSSHRSGPDADAVAEARQIINSQMALTEKIARADHVVWNDGGESVLKSQATLLVRLWQTEQWTKK